MTALRRVSLPGRVAARALGGVAALALLAVAILALGGAHGQRVATRGGSSGVAASHSRLVTSRGVADPEAAQSSPLPAGATPHVAAITPGQAALATTVSPGAPSDAQVRAQLRQQEAATSAAALDALPGTISLAGTVAPPRSGPAAIARVIAGANAIADFPYVYGGGHGSFVDTAYDCSGSVSYALAAAGMLNAPLTSGDFETWGAPGPGRYLTVYANAGHMFMYVDGVRYDTSGRTGTFSSRWQTASRGLEGFVVRHWPGL